MSESLPLDDIKSAVLRAILKHAPEYLPDDLEVLISSKARGLILHFAIARECTLIVTAQRTQASAAAGAPRSAPAGAELFVPTPFQEAILEALEGVALRTRALGAAVGDPSRLYRPGGLAELRQAAWWRTIPGWASTGRTRCRSNWSDAPSALSGHSLLHPQDGVCA